MTPVGRGSAVVSAISPGPEGSALLLLTHTGAETQLVVPALPDPVAGRRDSTAVRRPQAVIIRTSTAGTDRVLLGTSRRGPVRRATTLGSALALCQSGVRTVVQFDD